MQQRTKRFLKIWAITVVCLVVALAGLAGVVVLAKLAPAIMRTVFGIGLTTVGIWMITWQIAKFKLEEYERKEARVLRELSKGYNE